MAWPGAGALLVLAMMVFGFLFLPLLCVLKIKEQEKAKDKLLLTLATIVGSLYTYSMLALVMHFPYSHYTWLLTLSLCFFVFIPIYFFTGIRKPETRLNTIVASIMLIAFTGMHFVITSLKPKPVPKSSNTEQLVMKK
jgi:hypothetical protein